MQTIEKAKAMNKQEELTEMINKTKYFIFIKDEQSLWCILDRKPHGASGFALRLKFLIGKGDYLEADEFYAANDVMQKQVEKYPEFFTKKRTTALSFLGNGKTIGLVEVPEGTGKYTLRTSEYCDNGSISFYDKLTGKETTVLIPKGKWLDKGIASKLSEEEWRKIVDCLVEPDATKVHYPEGIWKNYTIEQSKYGGLNYDTATESGLSLLKKHNMKAETTLLIQKQ